MFGGQTVGRVVLCNAVTGEMTDYSVDEVPTWVDKVYSAELLINLYDYNGSLKHGFINSVLSQKDCLKTTDGYNYIALEDDVWVYTGITSVGQDNSNVGFVLMNQRTMETRYYEVSEKYQNVSIGDSVLQCESNYIKLLKDNGIVEEQQPEVKETKKVKDIISKIMPVVIDGNTHMYIMLSQNDSIYDVDVSKYVDIIKYSEGMEITLEYTMDSQLNKVVGIIK